ncbi:ParD-like family protein [Sodalis sp. dw_96]|uniref:ParD-like family protein n=1 Tax=Sodalis sp. dw_96 TaxID=2719794 RepID=UPI001BD5FB10|nr:ParD-like family protein [Sodalis sp. dw_96]
MSTSVRLDDDFVSDIKVHAEAASRSIPKQIEHWAKIGRIAEDNPDLPYSFIVETLLAQSEVENNKVTRYARRTNRSKD